MVGVAEFEPATPFVPNEVRYLALRSGFIHYPWRRRDPVDDPHPEALPGGMTAQACAKLAGVSDFR
jgi:hypothetical protein